MSDHVTSLGIIRIITFFVFIAISIYVFYENKKWVSFSQGIKPFLLGLLVLIVASIIRCIELNIDNINDFFKILVLHDSTKFSVGISRTIALGYIVMLYGLEISLIVSVKKIKLKKERES